MSGHLRPRREVAVGVEFTLPTGWRRLDDPAQASITLFPGELSPAVCGVVVLPVAATTATAEEHHAATWAKLTASLTVFGAAADSAHGLFRASRARFRTAQGQSTWMCLYTAKGSKAVATVLFAASSRAQFTKHGAEADALVATMAFAGAARSPDLPTPLPPTDRDVAMVGLWINGSTGLRYGIDPGGTLGTRLRSRVEMLALWENGVAYRGVHDAPIVAGKGLLHVREGFAVVDAASLATEAKFADDRYSRWSEKDGVIDIPINRYGALQLTRDQRHLVARDGAKWVNLAPVDGVSLAGTFACAATVAAPAMRFAFGADGTFAAQNVVHAFGGPTNNATFPMQGNGTYECKKWSLILRFDGGYTQAIQFLGGDGLPDAKAIVLAGAEFARL